MMRFGPRSRGLVVLSWLAASGCTTLREIPRDSYATVPERKRVTVETRGGGRQEFDYAEFGADTLKGYRQQQTEGGIEEYAMVAIPIDDVTRVSARRLDWYRTLLLGGSSLAGVVVTLVSLRKSPEVSQEPPGKPCEPCQP